MQAIVYHKYGSPEVLSLEEVAKPAPKDDEVLIKVHAASVNAGDWHLMRGDPVVMRLMFGLFKPKNEILGIDVAGEVEAVGNSVTQFKPGDAVLADLSECGFGGFAEYVCATEKFVALKPSGVSFDDAAAVPTSGVTALQGLRDHGKIQAGQQVLINGASGGVGSFAVQLAKSFETEVTATCSTAKVEMVRALGADHVIDYKQADVTQSGQHFDLIVDTGAFRPVADYKRILSPKGNYVMIGGSVGRLFGVMLFGGMLSKADGQTFGSMLVKPNQSDLVFMAGLLEAGTVKPVIDKRYSLSQTVSAIRYMESGQVQGKVVIAVS